LFENFDSLTVTVIEDQIRQTIRNFEPRVGEIGVEVNAFPDNNEIEVRVIFEIDGLDLPQQSFTFILEPTR